MDKSPRGRQGRFEDLDCIQGTKIENPLGKSGAFPLIGKIIKIHSDFYYVKLLDTSGIASLQLNQTNQRAKDECFQGCIAVAVQCKIREILKKEHKELFVGDNVELSNYNQESNQAVITDVLPRSNFISKPSVANIDQIVIVTSLKEPSIDYIQLNRYICSSLLYGSTPIICINKCDLVKNEQEIKEINDVYSTLGYDVIFTSALKNSGINALKNAFKSKTSVLCGSSGVGKSSLINSIQPGLHLKTKEVSSKNSKGTHTTRHSEIITIAIDKDDFADVVDTPGFSYLKFDDILPKNIEELFPEIKNLSVDCKYNDCLHIEENDCNVLKNLKKIQPSRYESYKAFIQEAKEYKEKLYNFGSKEEEKTKTLDSKKAGKVKIVKLGTKARDLSRKNQKQKLNNLYYENIDE
ncbi:MAG: ribosome small subunit-dependent GTPase A [Candidatus Gastranaerophilaceae bacterium]|jgi:ribosome biogenesis GTPase